jgi:hypothetical protein
VRHFNHFKSRGPRRYLHPTPVLKCACGEEEKRRGTVVGLRCWSAAPANLRKEVYSRDAEVARAAALALVDFARSRRPAALTPQP